MLFFDTDNGVFPCPRAIVKFSFSVMIGTSETKIVSFDVVLCLVIDSSVKVNSTSFSFRLQVPFLQMLTFYCLTSLLK